MLNFFRPFTARIMILVAILTADNMLCLGGGRGFVLGLLVTGSR